MLRLKTIQEAQGFVFQHRAAGRTVGLVPTMGALHEGHLSLIKHSVDQCDVSVATIFVNPTQFGADEDLGKYPRTIEADCDALERRGVHAVFVPDVDEMYPHGYSTFVDPPTVAKRWEGEFRPQHFRGVATVVLKLFNALPATHAFFGRKDYQQLRVIETMVCDLNVGIKIVGCETIREADGLAMSSRNIYLDTDQRERALSISRSIQKVANSVASGVTDATLLHAMLDAGLTGSGKLGEGSSGVDGVDYAVIVDPITLEPLPEVVGPAIALVACRVGGTRLIDNGIIST